MSGNIFVCHNSSEGDANGNPEHTGKLPTRETYPEKKASVMPRLRSLRYPGLNPLKVKKKKNIHPISIVMLCYYIHYIYMTPSVDVVIFVTENLSICKHLIMRYKYLLFIA